MADKKKKQPDKVWPNDWSKMGVGEGKGGKKVSLRLNADDGELKSNPVSDGGVGGTFGPRADPEVLDTHRKNAKALALMLAYQGSRKGGVNSIDELLMVLRYFPMGLLSAYLRLIDASVGEKNTGSGRGYSDTIMPGVGERRGPRIKTSSADQVGLSKSKVRTSGAEMIRSERMLGYRRKVDRKLRKLTREINECLATSTGDATESVQRRCAGSCKQIGDGEWLFCPKCGGRMEET